MMGGDGQKLSYEKPEVVFWAAAELDTIQATMSGGGGGSSGGGGSYSGGSGFGGTSADTMAYVYGFLFDDGFDTTALAAQEQMYLSNMGYTAYCNTDKAAYFAVGTSQSTGLCRMNTGVFVFNGHAHGGSCSFFVNPSETFLSAERTGSPYYSFGTKNMAHCKAAFFFGCKTAQYLSGYGSLIAKAVDNGADCAFGWNVSVLQVSLLSFCERFFYFLRYGYTVSDAALNAASEMPWCDGTRAYTICGDDSTILNMSAVPSRSLESRSRAIEIDAAFSIIEGEGYRKVHSSGQNFETYVKYVGGIPTLESISIDRAKRVAWASACHFDDSDERAARALLSSKSRFKTIEMDCGEIARARGYAVVEAKDDMRLLCKPSDGVALVRVAIFECELDGGSSCLQAVCIDMLTGEEVEYGEMMGLR